MKRWVLFLLFGCSSLFSMDLEDVSLSDSNEEQESIEEVQRDLTWCDEWQLFSCQGKDWSEKLCRYREINYCQNPLVGCCYLTFLSDRHTVCFPVGWCCVDAETDKGCGCLKQIDREMLRGLLCCCVGGPCCAAVGNHITSDR